jgi:hypothetical protein
MPLLGMGVNSWDSSVTFPSALSSIAIDHPQTSCTRQRSGHKSVDANVTLASLATASKCVRLTRPYREVF